MQDHGQAQPIPVDDLQRLERVSREVGDASPVATLRRSLALLRAVDDCQRRGGRVVLRYPHGHETTWDA